LPLSGRHFFFWYRGDISFSELKKFIRPEDVDSFIYKSNPDISYQTEVLSEEDIIKYKITFIKQGYTSREEYLKQMSRANIYIAPRKREGVGLSYIEAIAMGHCIIAYDNVTMNEYIEDGVNGYLIGNSHSKTIDFDNVQKITEESRKRAMEGYRNWEKSIPNIISFMKSESPKKTTQIFYPIYRGLYEIEKKIPWWKRTFFRHYIRLRNKYNQQ
jgi:glycosyltransferase involved in cell wall biosynthesis